MPNSSELATIGDRIRYLREAAGLNQSQLSRLVGRSTSWCGLVEHQRIVCLFGETAQRLADVFGVAPRFITRGGDAPDPAEVREAVTSYIAHASGGDHDDA